MNKNELKKRVSLAFLVAAACWLLPLGLSAQGLLQKGGNPEKTPERYGLFGRSGGLFDDLSLQNFGEDDDDLTLQAFGENAPLGSGLLVMLASGVGYAALKSRKKQTSKTKQKH